VTSEVSYIANVVVLNWESTTIFLKVQTRHCTSTNRYLKNEKIKLILDAERGLAPTFADAVKRGLERLKWVFGRDDPKAFITKNGNNVLVLKEEVCSLRIYSTVWDPIGGTLRTRDMPGFIEKNYKVQVNLAKFANVVTAPMKMAPGAPIARVRGLLAATNPPGDDF
jgi:hypothetical protein